MAAYNSGGDLALEALLAGENTTSAEGPSFRSRFVWYELASPDLAASKVFYNSVLGWDASDPNPGESAYTVFLAGGTPVAGLNFIPPAARSMGAAAQWIGNVAVTDVDLAARRVTALGGQVFVPPSAIPNVGRFSVVADPDGANLVLVKRIGQNPADLHHAGPGHVTWHELNAMRPERSFAFYHALFGWEEADAREFSLNNYQVLSDGTETFGGIVANPDHWRTGFWRYYFHVSGINAAVNKVKSSGGKVFEEPLLLPSGAWVAHCADPAGALFGLIDTTVRFVIGCYAPRDPPRT